MVVLLERVEEMKFVYLYLVFILLNKGIFGYFVDIVKLFNNV